MKAEEIKLWDWSRILIGEVPAVFLLEVILRVTIMYLILIFAMRLIGKRMSAELTRNELAALVSLAAAIGVPILSPDRGVLPAFVIAAVVVSVSRITSKLSAKNEKIESITQGSFDTIIENAVMKVKAMTKVRISKERVLAELRSSKIKHLGEVKRLYMEANGTFSVIREPNPKPGLMVIPEFDEDFVRQFKLSNSLVCHLCGNPGKKDTKCQNCGKSRWVNAVEYLQ